MPAAPPTKKRKQAERVHPSARSESTAARTSLTSLPLEILAEVLLYTRSPPTVLAVSRTCSFLYRTLALNPAASYVWRQVRNTFDLPLPDLADNLGKSEAEYAAFVFAGGVCEVCHKTTRSIYVSFAVRIRLCGSWHCRRKFIKECLIDVSADLPTQDSRSIWVPCVESQQCLRAAPGFGVLYGLSAFSIHIPTWPDFPHFFVRKTDWEKFQLDLVAYETAEQALAMHKGGDTSTSLTAEEEVVEGVIERCSAAVQRFHVIMEASAKLIRWKIQYDARFATVKSRNQAWTQGLAEREGWKTEDLIASQAYSSLQGRKNYLLEEIRSNDVSAIRTVIESELLAIQARRKRQKSEAAYKRKLTEVKKIYERMRCDTPGRTADPAYPSILPPLSVFFTLPSVRVLKGSPNPNAIPPSSVSTSRNIKSSTLAMSLIVSDIHAWLVPVEAYVMRLLGYPNGWQSASTRAVSPLNRVTARFFCRRCGESKVGRGYQRPLCLDFKGVCSHVCVAAQRKGVEGPHQEEPRETDIEDTDVGDGNGQGEGGKMVKKRRGVKVPEWAVDMFEKDEKAIRIIKAILELIDYSEEDPSTTSKLSEMDGTIRCKTCEGWIVMDFDTAIGHAHRHESMEIEFVPCSSPLCVVSSEGDRRILTDLHTKRYEFRRGVSELLLSPSHHARNLCKKTNYGCKHCFSRFYEDLGTGAVRCVKEDGWKVMNFNGLRSHVKEKHGIRDIRDEDFFCFSPIDDGEKRQ